MNKKKAFKYLGIILVISFSINLYLLFTIKEIIKPDEKYFTSNMMPCSRLSLKNLKIYEDNTAYFGERTIYVTHSIGYGSMRPYSDINITILYWKKQPTDKICVGDVISYKKSCVSNDNSTIHHRIIAENKDENGTYYIAKGDNNPTQDGCKVRPQDIIGIDVGVIY